jgi:hypothetical protein
MKDGRDKRKNERSAKRSGKSLHQLYHELLYLREQVRAAEQWSSKMTRKAPRSHDDKDHGA